MNTEATTPQIPSRAQWRVLDAMPQESCGLLEPGDSGPDLYLRSHPVTGEQWAVVARANIPVTTLDELLAAKWVARSLGFTCQTFYKQTDAGRHAWERGRAKWEEGK